MRIGVVSDTHGLVRPRALDVLFGVDRILHAGDVGHPDVLTQLATIAPVTAVRGNVDTGATLAKLPLRHESEAEGLRFGLVHRRADIPAAWPRDLRFVVFGHSHQPEMSWEGSCLLLNPGSCGRRRFHLPATIAILTLRDGRVVPEILSVE